MRKLLLLVFATLLCSEAFPASVITTRLEDPRAVYLEGLSSPGDSSAILQAAINKASGEGREGIVFVAAGTYSITRTVYIWPGVRVIGYGLERPIFVLPPNTPGFQKGMGVMVMFSGATAMALITQPFPGFLVIRCHLEEAA